MLKVAVDPYFKSEIEKKDENIGSEGDDETDNLWELIYCENGSIFSS